MTVEHAPGALPAAWAAVPAQLRERGLRWTPQRRLLIEVLAAITGHITGVELVERCRAIDPATTPSTVYRTLDVLEELGAVRHCHGADGREEYHVRPGDEHGHLYCQVCRSVTELGEADLAAFAEVVERRYSFDVDPSHVTIVGRCAACAASAARPAE